MRANHLLRKTSRNSALSGRKGPRQPVGTRRRRLAAIACAVAVGFTSTGDGFAESPARTKMPRSIPSGGIRNNPFVQFPTATARGSGPVVLASDTQTSSGETSGLRLKSIGSAVGLVPIGAPRPEGMPIAIEPPASPTVQSNPHATPDVAEPFAGPAPRAAVVIAPQPEAFQEAMPAPVPADKAAQLQWAPVPQSQAAVESSIPMMTVPAAAPIEESVESRIDQVEDDYQSLPVLPPLPTEILRVADESGHDDVGFSFSLSDQLEPSSEDVVTSDASVDSDALTESALTEPETVEVSEEQIPDFNAIIAERRAAWAHHQANAPERPHRHRAAVAVVAAPLKALDPSRTASLVTPGVVRTAERWNSPAEDQPSDLKQVEASSLKEMPASVAREVADSKPVAMVAVPPQASKTVSKPQTLKLDAELGEILTQELPGKIVMIDMADGSVCSAVGEGSTELKLITRGMGEAKMRIAYMPPKSLSIRAIEIVLNVSLPAARKASPPNDHDAILEVLRKRYPRSVVEIEPGDRQLTVRGVCDSREEATEIIRLIRKSNLTPVEDRLVVR